jgi:hypothetical protein
MQEHIALLDCDMANQDERIKGLETQNVNIRERLSAIEGRFNVPAASPNAILITVLTIVGLAFIGYLGWLGVQVVDDGRKITAILTIVAPQTLAATLSSAISTQTDQAKKGLAQAATTIRQLQSAKVRLPDKVTADTSDTLTKISDVHQDLPETWSAIGEFITYRSQMVHGWQETNSASCNDQFHRFKMTAPIDEETKTITHGPVEVHDCKIILDSPEATSDLSIDLSFADIIFTHCTVFYNGGPVVLVPIKVARDNPPKLIGRIIFQDCAFILNLPKVPSPQGIEFTRALLSNPTEHLEFGRQG